MTLKKALVSLSLALTGSIVLASPVLYEQGGLNGNFSKQYSFTVDSEREFNGVVNTRSKNFGEIEIYSVVLSQGSVEYRFDAADDAFKFLSVTDTSENEIIKGSEVQWYRKSYELSPVKLSAGQWVMTVNGFDVDNKTNGFFSAALTDVSSVPEPQTLALLGAAGLGMFWVSRRKAKNSAR
ncbi:PEP-CTERM sorting domain-containing protein [Roseateles violae]|uniref:PEP-CTERM sorting domain-containing protein n=1 Tax=Roseateles violae TaxID=3058042 RepID=A0ABT8DY59_9BURK|nr:PEP-CTERM sorting domain-containing protein [Pelomonas sp. PFR6]MDN3922124.1 PEP-CTERM sorting domain-containing protein [Pelomonas sp. PFR6]